MAAVAHPALDKDWWTTPHTGLSPQIHSTATAPTTVEPAAPAPKKNPFLSGDEPAVDNTISQSTGQAGSQQPHNPRKDFEAGLASAARGVFQLFGPKQSGNDKEEEARRRKKQQEHDAAVNADWGGSKAARDEGWTGSAPTQGQYDLKPYGQAPFTNKDDISRQLEQLELEVQGTGRDRQLQYA
jgi:hypothetical protein